MGEAVDRNDNKLCEASPEKIRRDPNKSRIAVNRLDIPASKRTLDIQFLVMEEKEACNKCGIRFFQGKFLARLIRVGVGTIVSRYPERATPIMCEIANSEPIATFLRRREALRLHPVDLPHPDSAIPDIIHYYDRRFDGLSLRRAYFRNMITGKELVSIYKTATTLGIEIMSDRDLSLAVKQFWQKTPELEKRLELLVQEIERRAQWCDH